MGSRADKSTAALPAFAHNSAEPIALPTMTEDNALLAGEIDPAVLLEEWGIVPRSLRLADRGSNNRTYQVDSAAGQYYLRHYRSDVFPDRVRYEHELLGWLAGQDLPFQVPAPVRLPSEETYLLTKSGTSEMPIFAALFAAIPGVHRERKNLSQAENAGRAVGLLNTCLGQASDLPRASEFATYGELGLYGPGPRVWLKSIAELPADPATRTSIETILVHALDLAPELYEKLPTQVIHADFSASNTLFLADQVSGVIDFEYAQPDLRVFDFVSGLETFCFRRGGASIHWNSAEAFCKGFSQAARLTVAEVDALPQLLRLRSAVVLAYWIERWLQGSSGDNEVSRSLVACAASDQWLLANGDELANLVGGLTA